MKKKEDLSQLNVKELMIKIYKEKDLNHLQQKEIIDKSLKIAEDSDDYQNIATNVCHDDVLANKQWGKELFEKALTKVEVDYGTSGLYDIARQIADKKQLNDKEWAKEVYIQAIDLSQDIDDLLVIADDVADIYNINDKNLSKVAIDKALSISSNSSDKIEIIKLICHEDILNDKLWSKKLLKTIENNLDYGSDHLEIAIIYSNVKCLNDKKNGEIWFKRAVKIEDLYDGGDYFQIASYVFDENNLNNKKLAADICIGGYTNTYNIQDLIGMSKITFQTDKVKAKDIINYAMDLVEKDDDYSSDDFFNIAVHVSDESVSNIPYFNDITWGKQIFEKAITKAITKDDKDKIIARMKKYL